MLQLRDITKTFRGPRKTVRAVDGVSINVGAGEFVAIRGPSGCGKSTLLLTAGALLAPDAGSVLLDGRDVYALSPEARAALRARSIGFVFQRFHLLPYLSARENVLAASIAAPAPDAGSRADELLRQLGLEDRADHLPAQLSTGERQRVALARALLNNPRLLLADEPTGNLDPENGQIVLKALADFAARGGAVLLVTHDPAATTLATRVLSMSAGRLVNGAPSC